MLTESFVAATLISGKSQPAQDSTLKDVGIVVYEFQPQSILRQGYKKSSVVPRCLAVSETHIFAAQADKAIVNVYNRSKGNQEATVPFPERVCSLQYVERASTLILGTEGGKLMLWEVGTGRLTISAASHLQPVSTLCVSDQDLILSGSSDSAVHVWSISNLLSFVQPAPSYTAADASKSPLRTFSNHRDAITSLSCGHSKSYTNFAVSGSVDRTCYLWRISDCQILRTFLLPSAPTFFTLDPADRAVYTGYESGHIQNIDLFTLDPARSIYESVPKATKDTAIQLRLDEAWAPPNTTTGAVTCGDLSYDGTILLTGTSGGQIFSWDVGKRRFVKEIVNVGPPSVTCLCTLRPDGFLDPLRPSMIIPTVVKPKMELSLPLTEPNSLNMPPHYTLYAQVTPGPWNESTPDPEVDSEKFTRALTHPIFPRELVDAALQGLLQEQQQDGHSESTDSTEPQLRSQIQTLESQLAHLNSYISRQRERKVDRLRRLEELGNEKRRAFLQARRDGRDGWVAMREWEEREREVEMEESPPED